MILLNIDKKSQVPLYTQIYNQIKGIIDDGILKPGYHLPSSRSLAMQLGINRTTVYKAYEELWAFGYIESKSGAYSTVRQRTAIANKIQNNVKLTINWADKLSKSANILKDIYSEKEIASNNGNFIDFRPLSPDVKIIPNEDFRRCIDKALYTRDKDILLYGDSQGYLPLRDFISTHMKLHAINANSNEIVITNGAQHAIELLIKLLTNPGNEILIESPTYSSIIPMLRSYNLQVLQVPLNNNGIDLSVLESLLKKHSPKFLYTMPNFQNPSGVTTNQEHREKLLLICEKYGIPIIEDGFVEEMKYFGRNILPIKSMDNKGLVFYVGTFSKILFPGIRIGWIASNDYCSNRLAELIKSSEISVSTINQSALNLFCRKGLLEKQLKKVNRVYKKRMELALKILRENLRNQDVKYIKPIGGYTIWFEIKNKNLSELELIELFKNEKVLVTPGSLSFYNPTNSLNFRISIAHRAENEIETGLMNIINILNNI